MNFFLFLLQAATSPDTANTVIENTTQVAPKAQSPWSSFIMIALMFLIFYFLLIRPNQKREKERRKQLSALTEGDKIITNGGIKGTITSVKDDCVTIDSKGTKLEIVKFAIAKVIK